MYAAPVQDLIDELGRLPGIGPKSAQRIAFHLLKLPAQDATRLARAIEEMKARISFCQRCFNVSEGVECEVCADTRRDTHVVCVVEATAVPSAAGAAGPGSVPPAEPDDHVDLDALVDAPSDHRTGIDRLTEAFPGAEVVDGA